MDVVSSETNKELFVLYINSIIKDFNNKEFKSVINSGEKLLIKNQKNTFLINLIGIAQSNEKNYTKAIYYFKKATQLDPNYAEAYNNWGVCLNENSKYELALYPLKKAIYLKPNYCEALNNIGNSYRELGNFNLSQNFYEEAIKIKPTYYQAMSNLALSLMKNGNLKRSADFLEKSLSYNSSYIPTLINRGLYFFETGENIKSLNDFKTVLELDANHSKAHNNISNVLSSLGEHKKALEHSKKAIELDDSISEFFNNLGNCYLNLEDYDNAIESYQRGIINCNNNTDLFFNLARAYLYSGENEKALSSMLEASENKQAFNNFDIKTQIIKMIKSLKSSELIPPLVMMSLVNDFEVHYLTAQHYCNKRINLSFKNEFNSYEYNGVIKVGFFSADFKNHPVMHLLKNAFTLYDKKLFEISIFSFGNEKNNDEIKFLKTTVNHFFCVNDCSDTEIIQLSRDLNIEIAIDLMGHTKFSRPNLFLNRLAPVQINYLGYPGTFGSNCMDYIIGDKSVIPLEKRQYFSEKVIYMPDTFMMSDDSKSYNFKISKLSENLPDNKFIFCCFNNGYKISNKDLQIWCQILLEVKDSVIWLAHQSDLLKEKLLDKFKLNGIDCDRIIFAKKVHISQHLARHKLADLFLDTLNYNAHTTAIDAINSCLPILTLLGNSFPSRVAGSILNSLGLEELVVSSEEEYIKKGIALGKNKKEIDEFKTILNQKKENKQLLNTQQYITNFEYGLKTASQRFRLSLPKKDIYIE